MFVTECNRFRRAFICPCCYREKLLWTLLCGKGECPEMEKKSVPLSIFISFEEGGWGNAFVYASHAKKHNRVRGTLRLTDVLLPGISSGYRDRAQTIGNSIFQADIVIR